MTKIHRNPAAAASRTYDLIIVGGGIYGAMLSLGASRRALRSLLIERGDFGGATTFNCLRIIHGGLRYLQNFDLRRLRESAGERRWFLQTFPDLVKPLPCLMPLYGNGLRRPSILRVALRTSDILSQTRKHETHPDSDLPPGRIVDARSTRGVFPAVDTQNLKGGAVWYDAFVSDSQRLLLETLRWSCRNGGTALNYVDVQKLLNNESGVCGVLAVDLETGESHAYNSRTVINAAGPWCRDLAARFDRDIPALYRKSIAWNVLLDREALSDHALALSPKQRPDSRVYFLLPFRGKLLAGTGHAPRHADEMDPVPSPEELRVFLDDLNMAVPSLQIDKTDMLHVFAGFLPVDREGSLKLSRREVIFDHRDHGGPKGLYTVSGVKFTTARLVAEKTLTRVFPGKRVSRAFRPNRLKGSEDAQYAPGTPDFISRPENNGDSDSGLRGEIWRLISEESVQHLDDLVLRRTGLWENPSVAMEMAPLICRLFDWTDSRSHEEIQRLRNSLGMEAHSLDSRSVGAIATGKTCYQSPA